MKTSDVVATAEYRWDIERSVASVGYVAIRLPHHPHSGQGGCRICDAETDLMHQRVALTGVIRWLRPHTYAEVIAEERGQKLREREPAAA